MGIFEELENLNVSEECFESILDLIEGILTPKDKELKSPRDVYNETQEKPPVVYHKFSNGQTAAQGQLFKTNDTGKTVKGPEVRQRKLINKPSTGNKGVPQVEGQLHLFNGEENK